MNINVDHKKLYEFAGYVSDFSKKINTECAEVKNATYKVASRMDPDDIHSIMRLTQNIASILEAANPELNDLQKKIVNYADMVARVKAIMKGG